MASGDIIQSVAYLIVMLTIPEKLALTAVVGTSHIISYALLKFADATVKLSSVVWLPSSLSFIQKMVLVFFSNYCIIVIFPNSHNFDN